LIDLTTSSFIVAIERYEKSNIICAQLSPEEEAYYFATLLVENLNQKVKKGFLSRRRIASINVKTEGCQWQTSRQSLLLLYSLL